MAETYCAKSCSECTYKEELNCPGCRLGPGQQFGGDCELARCCRSKGHEACATCSFSVNCSTLRGKERVPEARKKQMLYRQIQEAAMDKKAPILAKWLSILFWLVVPNFVGSLMSLELWMETAPGLYLTGKIISAACSVAYGLILLKLASQEEMYHGAAVCRLAAAVVSGAILIFSHGTPPTWTLFLSVPAAIVSLVGQYKEFSAHAQALSGVDNLLSEQWTSLWRWNLASYGGLVGGIVLVLILPILGLLLVLAASIALLVVSVLYLVRLYNTAQTFRARACT